MRPFLRIALLSAALAPCSRAQNGSQPTEIGRVPAAVASFTATADGRRIYYGDGSSQTDTVWVLDVATGRRSVALVGQGLDLAVSPKGDALAYRRSTDQGGTQTEGIWMVPLDANGVATGTAQRVTITAGVIPKFSPDGAYILYRASETGTNRRLVVVPVHGGAERRVVPDTGAYQPLGWSADGRSIFYGIDGYPGHPGGIFRVPANGGTPTRLVSIADWVEGPGLSPSGDVIGYKDGDATRLIDVTGRSFAVAGYADRWLGPSKLLVRDRDRGALRTLAIADGADREVIGRSNNTIAARWSTTGAYAALTRAGGTTTLQISGPGASRSVQVPSGSIDLAWSPNGAMVAVVGNEIMVIDAATGRVRSTTAAQGKLVEARWSANSKLAYYISRVDVAGGQGNFTVRAITSMGKDSVIRAIGTGDRARFIGADRVALTNNAGVTGVGLDGRKAQLFAGGWEAGASESGDRIAIRTAGNTNSVRIISNTGAALGTAKFPFAVGPGNNLKFVFGPDANSVFAVGNRGPGECCALYQGFLDGREARRLTYVTRPSGFVMIDLSPDGKTLLYTTGGPAETAFLAIDVSPLLPRR